MFKLLRYFSLTSAIVLTAATALLASLYRHVTIDLLIDHSETANVSLTGALANSIWPDFASHVTSATALTEDELRAHPETSRLHHTVLRQLRGLSVIKVKIYDASGLTVFSTQASQIGEDKSTNFGFLSARSGEAASELTHRGTFSAFENEIENRDVISSYVPIRGATGEIDGVFEIYGDVTPLLAKINETHYLVIAASILIFSTIYGILFLIVRRADKILEHQHQDIHDKREELACKNDQLEGQITERVQAEDALRDLNEKLEQRVSERTAEVRQKATELEWALETQKEYNALQQEFVSMVSHEFRTPLTIIDGAARRITRHLDRLTAEEVGERLEPVREAVQRMTGLIESTLNLGKHDAGKIAIAREYLDLAGSIEQVCKRQKLVAPLHEISLDLRDAPKEFYGDPKLIDQIFSNLLSNAIKYSPDNAQIEVSARVDGDRVAVSVRDHGLGISVEDCPRIFDRYFRAKSSIGIAGTGIGLTLVKRLVEMHGGSVRAESVEGEGSTFIVQLPITGSADKAADNIDKREPVAGLELNAVSGA